MIRRSVPAPLSGGLFVKYSQFGWSAAESRRSTRRSTAPVSASTSMVQASGTRPLSTTLASNARRMPPLVGTATSRTCWSWASPPTRSWPKPARAAAHGHRSRLDAGVAGRGPPGLLAGQPPRALRARRARRARRTRRRRGRRTMPTASMPPPATGQPADVAAEQHDVGVGAREAGIVDELAAADPARAEQRGVAAQELARAGLRRAGEALREPAARAEDAARGAEAVPAHAGAEARRGGALRGRRARAGRAGRSCPGRSRARGSRPRRTRRRAPSAPPRPPDRHRQLPHAACAPSLDRPLAGRLDRVPE